MGKVFTLSPNIVTLATDTFTDLLNQLGKPCRLIYPPKQVSCPNCVFDAVGNKSANVWLDGGPQPFPNGQECPMCNGVFYAAQEVTRPITLLIAWAPAQWFVRAPNGFQIPDGMIQTKGFIADLPFVLQARQMVIETPIEGMNRYRFFLDGEPVDVSNITPGRFFVSRWRRGG